MVMVHNLVLERSNVCPATDKSAHRSPETVESLLCRSPEAAGEPRAKVLYTIPVDSSAYLAYFYSTCPEGMHLAAKEAWSGNADKTIYLQRLPETVY